MLTDLRTFCEIFILIWVTWSFIHLFQRVRAAELMLKLMLAHMPTLKAILDEDLASRGKHRSRRG